MKIKNIILAIITLMISTTFVYAGTYKADARTKRIPAGTVFELEFIQPVSSFSSCEGDSFVATIKNEISTERNIIVPMGSVVRGSIAKVNTAKRFSRGGKLYLDFDHVVTPNGRQIPLDMAVCQFDNIYYDGALYKNLGYGEAIQENNKKSVDIIKQTIDYGLKAGVSAPGMQYITTPFCAIGGVIGGAGYWLGDSVADMFRKGKDVYINKNEKINVKLINPIDIPVY